MEGASKEGVSDSAYRPGLKSRAADGVPCGIAVLPGTIESRGAQGSSAVFSPRRSGGFPPAQRVGRAQPRAEAEGRRPGKKGTLSWRPERPREVVSSRTDRGAERCRRPPQRRARSTGLATAALQRRANGRSRCPTKGEGLSGASSGQRSIIQPCHYDYPGLRRLSTGGRRHTRNRDWQLGSGHSSSYSPFQW